MCMYVHMYTDVICVCMYHVSALYYCRDDPGSWVCIYVRIHICMYVHMYIYMYRERARERERARARARERARAVAQGYSRKMLT